MKQKHDENGTNHIATILGLIENTCIMAEVKVTFAALQGYISRLSAILTVNISPDISSEAPYKKILYSTNMVAH